MQFMAETDVMWILFSALETIGRFVLFSRQPENSKKGLDILESGKI